MRDQSVANILIAFAILSGPCVLHTQQAKDASAPPAASDSSGTAKKGDAGQASAPSPAAGDSALCTVHPGSGTTPADAGAKGGGGGGSKGKNAGTGGDNSGSGTSVQVNQYAASQTTPPKAADGSDGAGKTPTTEVWELPLC
jgi:hypothetical protein